MVFILCLAQTPYYGTAQTDKLNYVEHGFHHHHRPGHQHAANGTAVTANVPP